MSNPKIHTSIEKNLVVLLALCLCAEANEHKNFSVKAPIFASLVRISGRKSVFVEYLKYMNGSSEVAKRVERISQADILAACIDYLKDNNKSQPQVRLFSYSTINGAEETVEFQVVVTDDNFTPGYYEYYNSLNLERKNCEQEGDTSITPKDKLFSIMLSIVMNFFSDGTPCVCLTSPGSKITFCRNIDFKKLFPVPGEGIIIEPFCRTAAFSMSANELVKEIILNDLDSNVVYYLTCLKEYPLYLINAIIDEMNSDLFKEVQLAISKGGKHCNIRSIYFHYLKQHIADTSYNAANTKRKSIFKVAACYFLLINLSYSGKSDSVNSVCVHELSKKKRLASKFMKMMSASVVLRKAIITHHDYKWVLERYKEHPDLVWIFIDPPYINSKSENDGTYGKADSKLGKFDKTELEKMCKLLKGAPRVLITHSRNDIVSGIMSGNKIELVGCYDTSINGKGSYVTDVFGRGITKGNGWIR